MKILFYISSHGYGHMARNIPIIATLLQRSEVSRVYVRCAKAHLSFLKANVAGLGGQEKLQCFAEQTDVGHVPFPGTMDFDPEATAACVQSYMAGWPERVRREAAFLRAEQVDAAVMDIVPWAFPACREAGVPSMLISNFTWVDIYQQYFGEEMLLPYRQCYAQADRALLYALSMPGMEQMFQSVRQVSYVCRPFHRKLAEQIRREHRQPIVFVGVGKAVDLQQEICVGGLPFDFVVTEGIHLHGSNVTVLDRDVSNTHDFIMASDFMISKAGWGSIAEAVLARKKLALISRPTVAEDCNSIRQLREQGLCLEISESSMQDMGTILQALQKMPPGDFSGCTNDVGTICGEILSMAEHRNVQTE